jgi:flagellar protein FlbD
MWKDAMIQLTRLNGEKFALNTDLIERVDETPDTVLALIDGTRYVVAEPIDEVIERIINFRARVVAAAEDPPAGAALHIVRDNDADASPGDASARSAGDKIGSD